MRILLFVLAGRSSPPRSSSVGKSRGVRRNGEGATGKKCGRSSPAREKRGQLADGHGAQEILTRYRYSHTRGEGNSLTGWFLSCFSMARTDSNRRLQITGIHHVRDSPPAFPPSHFFLSRCQCRSEWICEVSEAPSDFPPGSSCIPGLHTCGCPRGIKRSINVRPEHRASRCRKQPAPRWGMKCG